MVILEPVLTVRTPNRLEIVIHSLEESCVKNQKEVCTKIANDGKKEVAKFEDCMFDDDEMSFDCLYQDPYSKKDSKTHPKSSDI